MSLNYTTDLKKSSDDSVCFLISHEEFDLTRSLFEKKERRLVKDQLKFCNYEIKNLHPKHSISKFYNFTIKNMNET